MSDMDGEDYGVSDIEVSDGEEYYGGGDAVDNADYYCVGSESEDSYNRLSERKNCTVLARDDIRQRQEDVAMRISTVLSISRDFTCKLLRAHNWDAGRVEEEWFGNEDKVREAIGLLDRPVVTFPATAKELECGICFEMYPVEAIKSSACGHPYCKTCWEAYIRTSINDGPGCLSLRCPEPSCCAAVCEDMIDVLCLDEDKDKYRRYLLNSYVDDNKNAKWCPAPGCDLAVVFETGSGRNYDVSCACSYVFCWNCTETAHRPVDCDTVAKWMVKNSSESENANWILVNSKPCPKCKSPIQKGEGCMHMTCRKPCSFEFCWICLEPWRGHKSCNRYTEETKNGKYDKAEQQKKMAKKDLDKYAHYFKRWAENGASQKKALADLEKMETVQLEKLSRKLSLPETQLKFITDAWRQIIECRRVLKWTYAYGYYLPEEEHGKRTFFEYMQGEAETGLERLHRCAEKELKDYLEGNPPRHFDDFRSKLTSLTSVTRTYFDNLVTALENGLSDVDSSCKKTKRSENYNVVWSPVHRAKQRKTSTPNRIIQRGR